MLLVVFVGIVALCDAQAPANDSSSKASNISKGTSRLMQLAAQYLPPISHARGFAVDHLDYAKQYAQEDFLAHNNHFRYEHDTAYVDEKPAGAHHDVSTNEDPAVYADPLAYGHFPFGDPYAHTDPLAYGHPNTYYGGSPGYASGYVPPAYGRNTWFMGPYGRRLSYNSHFLYGASGPQYGSNHHGAGGYGYGGVHGYGGGYDYGAGYGHGGGYGHGSVYGDEMSGHGVSGGLGPLLTLLSKLTAREHRVMIL